MANLKKFDINFDYDSDSNSEKKNFSSNINEVIRPVLNILFLFTIRFHEHKKEEKRNLNFLLMSP